MVSIEWESVALHLLLCLFHCPNFITLQSKVHQPKIVIKCLDDASTVFNLTISARATTIPNEPNVANTAISVSMM